MTLDDVIARESIRDTIAGYTIAGDSRDAEAFARLFAENAILEFAGFPPVPGFRNQGREQIRQRISGWSSTPGEDPSMRNTSFIRHNLTTSRIELTGRDTARAKTYFIVFTDIGADHSGTIPTILSARPTAGSSPTAASPSTGAHGTASFRRWASAFRPETDSFVVGPHLISITHQCQRLTDVVP